jgi:hypothetical protein
VNRTLFKIFSCCLLFLMVLPFDTQILSANETANPSQWPSSPDASPKIESWNNAIRLYGSDRYQTGLASTYAMRGLGQYPFDSPDPTSRNASLLKYASDWWGLGICPRAIIIVAGDSPVDALAAGALSNASGKAQNPLFRREAASDPLFDPIGGYKRVDTKGAPVLLTASHRQGATNLSIATRLAVQDMRSGGCTQARDVIIVGGDQTVPTAVEQELLSIGIEEVFRVWGRNRFETAAKIAAAMGTASSPTQTKCLDENSSDGSTQMSFYANSVVEHRVSASECVLLENTVVIADGLEGVDALTAGWWTSYWGVPVLLHDGSAKIEQFTSAALQLLEVKNVIILGGTSRIPEAVVGQIKSASSGGAVLRIAGEDRYETSVKMAKQFGGWWAPQIATDFDSSILCITASSKGKGWADSLGAGPWCGTASGAASTFRPPIRLLPPFDGPYQNQTVHRSNPSKNAVPIILVAAESDTLPVVIENFLQQTFRHSDVGCSSLNPINGCMMPGFAVIFGGPSVVTDQVISRISWLLGGKSLINETSGVLDSSDAFVTKLNLSPLHIEAGVGNAKVCFPRGSYSGARWIITGLEDFETPVASVDVSSSGWFLSDADGVTRAGVPGAPGCLRFETRDSMEMWARLVSNSGRKSSDYRSTIGSDHYFAMQAPLNHQPVTQSDGTPTFLDASGGGSTIVHSQSNQVLPMAVHGSQQITITKASLVIELTRGAENTLPDTFTGSWSLETLSVPIIGEIAGEATFDGIRWSLRGRSDIEENELFQATGSGGFEAELLVNTDDPLDDQVSWHIDSFFNNLQPN